MAELQHLGVPVHTAKRLQEELQHHSARTPAALVKVRSSSFATQALLRSCSDSDSSHRSGQASVSKACCQACPLTPRKRCTPQPSPTGTVRDW